MCRKTNSYWALTDKSYWLEKHNLSGCHCYNKQTKEDHLQKLTLLTSLTLTVKFHVLLIQALFQELIQNNRDIFNFEVWVKCLHFVVSSGAFCQHFKVVCVCVCQLGGHFLLTGQSRLWELGGEEGRWQWGVEVQLPQSHGTTQQDNKPALSLSLHVSFAISVSLYLYLSAAESGNRNLKAASGFHILSALPLMVVDTQSIYLA